MCSQAQEFAVLVIQGQALKLGCYLLAHLAVLLVVVEVGKAALAPASVESGSGEASVEAQAGFSCEVSRVCLGLLVE